MSKQPLWLRLGRALFPGMTRGRAALGGVVLGGLISAVWSAPMSPLYGWRAEHALMAGNPRDAVAKLDAIAAWGLPSQRVSALERGARVYALDLRNPQAARERLLARLRYSATDVERAALHAEVARTWTAERDLQRAATNYRQAWRMDPGQFDYAMAAAELHFERGDYTLARTLWTKIQAADPSLSARAHLELGRCDLAEGEPESALSQFERAAEAAVAPHEQGAARLGIASALERLGNLEEALAEIDLADLPGDVLETRINGIEARQNLTLSDL